MTIQPSVSSQNSGAALVALDQIAKCSDFRFRQHGIEAAHKADLAKTILNTGKPLDPIRLWFPPDAVERPDGTQQRFIVLDGWHRLAAYRAAKWQGPIPTIIVRGDRRVALMAALDGNSRFVLPMTHGERLDAAWRLVREAVEPRFKVREVASLSGVGKRTVDQMRRRWAEMQPAGIEPTGDWCCDRRDWTLWEGDPSELLTDEERAREVEALRGDILDVIDRRKHPGRLILQDRAAVDDALCAALGPRRLLYLAQYGNSVEDAEEWLRLMRDQQDADELSDTDPLPSF